MPAEVIPPPPPEKHWLKVGMEFEGGWNRPTGRDVDRRLHRCGDGSVRCYGEHHTGEVSTAPADSVAELEQLIDVGYPDVVDNSCGFHVHLSFDTGLYHRLMDRAFWDHFLAFWDRTVNLTATKKRELFPEWDATDWARLIPRLAGQNNYTRREFYPEKQLYLASKGSHRYTHLNYCHGLHGTVECRLLPMFHDKAAAKRAVRTLLECFDSYLARPDAGQSVAAERRESPTRADEPFTQDFHKEIMVVDVAPQIVERIIVGDVVREDVNRECTLHPDWQKKAPKGSFKLLDIREGGDEGTRKVRERVERLLRKMAAGDFGEDE